MESLGRALNIYYHSVAAAVGGNHTAIMEQEKLLSFLYDAYFLHHNLLPATFPRSPLIYSSY